MPIAEYNFVWVANMEQYYATTADAALVREMMPYLHDMMLRFVESGFTSENLFVHPPGATAFLDWVAAPWDKRPYNLTMNLAALRALRAAANLAIVAGDTELLGYCRRRDRALTEAIVRRFWSEDHKGWRENIEPSAEAKEYIASKKAGRIDDPWQKIQISMSGNRKPTVCSRHGNSLAVLLRLGTPEQQAAAADLVVRAFDPKETDINNGMSPIWTDRIFGAMFESGRDADAVRLLEESYGRWAADGALHWGEGFGPGVTSQTCGSSVNWLLTSYILGIRPTKPGFAEAVFDPRPGSLQWAKGVVPTPRGNIKVEWKRGSDGRISIVTLEAPKGVAIQEKNQR
jgi:hypothetical protein